MNRRSEQRRKEEMIQNWQKMFPQRVALYCDDSIRIPLPKVMLSDLSWADLAHWTGYARGYALDAPVCKAIVGS